MQGLATLQKQCVGLLYTKLYYNELIKFKI